MENIKERLVMRKIILFTLLLIAEVSFYGSCQPNSTSTYEVGMVNPQAGKTYIFFKEVKTDTVTSQLKFNMDYLTPVNVSSLIQTLTNFRTVADTMFGEFTIVDAVEKRFIKCGLVQKDDDTNKYSGMTVTFWDPLDRLEQRPGFFIRKKK